MTNGAHTDSLDPAILDRWIEFLQIYVAQVVPKRPPSAALVASAVGQQVWQHLGHAPAGPVRRRDFAEQAQATFEADPRLRVLFENGAAPGPTGAPVQPVRRRLQRLAGAGDPTRRRGTSTVTARWSRIRRPADGTDSYTYDASRSQLTTLVGPGQDTVWLPLPTWQLARARAGQTPSRTRPPRSRPTR